MSPGLSSAPAPRWRRSCRQLEIQPYSYARKVHTLRDAGEIYTSLPISEQVTQRRGRALHRLVTYILCYIIGSVVREQGVCEDPLLFLTFEEGERDGEAGETGAGGGWLAPRRDRARGGSILWGPTIDAARG
jgi:hypothetical protein